MVNATSTKLRTTLAAALGLAVLAAAVPQLSWAHGAPAPLEYWGGFENPTVLKCHRAISRATRVCFDTTTRLRFRCASRDLVGRPCEADTLQTALDRATLKARQLVTNNCTDSDLMSVLGYLGGMPDVVQDVTKTCLDQSDAATSLVYGPAMFTGQVEPGTTKRDACLLATARYSSRVARMALRQLSRSLDIVAMTRMTIEQKQQMLDDAQAKIADLRSRAEAAINQICTPAEFAGDYGMSQSDFFDRLGGRADCIVGASHVQAAITCPAPVCGNGVKEPGEQCDDGNTSEADACDNSCQKTSCESFASTYELIQKAIFENKGCTTDICHGSSKSGNLDLRSPQSYDELVDQPSDGSPLKRINPGDRDSSFLYLKLAAKTFPDQYTVTGTPMPSGLAPLTPNELDAVRLWIQQGAPKTGVIAGTGDLLNACLPPADPIQIDPPAPPPAGTGVQIQMPQNALPAHSETEVCFASYYDVTDQVPEDSKTDHGTFLYKRKLEVQDPLSHHLIIHSYHGTSGPDDPRWGAWTCKGGPHDGETCDPMNLTFCGDGGVCGSQAQRAIACIGFGPPDYNDVTAPAFGGTQEPYSATDWPQGVYNELPLKGIIVWNSHAFNLTNRPGKVGAWVNFDFASKEEQKYPVLGGLIETSKTVFLPDSSSPTGYAMIPPFQTHQVSWDHTFEQGTHLFEMSSHMHKHGKLFQIWDPNGQLIYRSTEYNDPVQLDFSPEVVLDNPDPATRTYHYCATYDNGATNIDEVKRQSTSPVPPPPFPSYRCRNNPFDFVDRMPVGCVSGKPGQMCSTANTKEARDRSCDSAPGANDGLCDACNLTGGVTTEDEMFILIGYYYCDPAYPNCGKNNDGGFIGFGSN